MKATVIVPTLEHYLEDEDYPIRVFSSALTREEIAKVTGGHYEKQAITGSDDTFLVTFTNDPDDVPNKDENGEWFEEGVHSKGKLMYNVYIVDVESIAKVLDPGSEFHYGIEESVAKIENEHNKE